MYRFIRRMQVAQGKMWEATDFVSRTTDYARENFGHNTKAYQEVLGSVSSIIITEDYASLAELDDVRARIAEDSEYLKLLNEAMEGGYFVEGSIQDALYGPLWQKSA